MNNFGQGVTASVHSRIGDAAQSNVCSKLPVKAGDACNMHAMAKPGACLVRLKNHNVQGQPGGFAQGIEGHRGAEPQSSGPSEVRHTDG